MRVSKCLVISVLLFVFMMAIGPLAAMGAMSQPEASVNLPADTGGLIWTWIQAYWPFLLTIVILVADKIVAVTPFKWDDILLTAIKYALRTVGILKKTPQASR